MYFELSIKINRPPADVFAFLRDKDLYPREENSPVLLLEKTTPGPAGVDTCYLEIVRVFRYFRLDIVSRITSFDPPRLLAEDFSGGGMHGHLSYQFLPAGEMTLLMQREMLEYRGLLKLLEPLIRRMLGKRLRERLESIKTDLESGFAISD